MAVVNLLASFAEHVDTQLALASKEVVTGGALEARVGEMQVEMLLQV